MKRIIWSTGFVVRTALTALLVTAAVAEATGSDSAATGPATSVVLMLIDNVGYGDLGCYGNQLIKTPHIDRLARQGVRCTDFYVGSPSCMPSRGALLTGRHPVRNGLNVQLWKTSSTEQIGLPHRELLLPQLLRPQGYKTACFGKWNIGFARGSRPTERGFDEFFGHASGNIDYYTHIYAGEKDLYRGTQRVEVDGYSTDLFADAACEFIRRHARRPFFVYLPFNAAHYPNPRSKQPGQPCIWQAPAEHFQSYGYAPDEQDPKKRYRAVITALDAGIGRVVNQLDALGLGRRTLVILLSDNGAFMLPNRGLEVASNLPLRDGGVTLYEGGIRVPCIVRWPGRITPGTVCRRPLVSMDLFVMIVRAAGARLPEDRVIDGRDPTAAFPMVGHAVPHHWTGQAPSPQRDLCFQWGSRSAIRSGRYKLLRNKDDQPWKLYDLVGDPGETRDLAAEKPEVMARLARRFERWTAEVRQ